MTYPKARNWVAENTATIGTGDITLAGALTGYASFATFSDGDSVYYLVQQGNDRECGIGVYSNRVLVRDQILATFISGVYTSGGTPLVLNGDATIYNIIPAEFIELVGIDSEKLAGIEPGATADQTAEEVPFDPSTSSATATDVQAAISEIFDNLDLEIQNRTDADALLQTNIDTVQANLDAEEAARIAADDVLTIGLSDEITNRQNADAALQANIDAVDAAKIDKVGGDTGAAKLPYGAEVDRPVGTDPLIRGRTEDGEAEYFNPVTGEWGSVGGGGATPIITKDADFTVERKKAYGIDLSTNDIITATVPDGLSEQDWFTIIDTGNAFDDSHGCVIQLGTEEFIIQDDDNAFFHGERNGAYTFQKKGGVWVLVASSYGQDATFYREYIQNAKRRDKTSLRVAGQEYINKTGTPLEVNIYLQADAGGGDPSAILQANGLTVDRFKYNDVASATERFSVQGTIGNNESYILNIGECTVQTWTEFGLDNGSGL